MRTFISALLLFGLLSVSQASGTSAAGDTLKNPFLSAEELRALRPALPAASLRLRYLSSAGPSGDSQHFESHLRFDLSSDWVRYRDDNQYQHVDLVYDFVTDRTFSFRANGDFDNWNDLSAAGVTAWFEKSVTDQIAIARRRGYPPRQDACDAEMAGHRIGALDDKPAPTRLARDGDHIELYCNERLVSSAVLSDEAAPSTLWPAMTRRLEIHPELVRLLIAVQRVPREIQVYYRDGSKTQLTTWTLEGIDHINAPYPLVAAAHNVTAPINATVQQRALMSLARRAVSGAAGPHDLQSWQARLERDGSVEAMLAQSVSFDMYPFMRDRCAAQPQDRSPVCLAARRRSTSQDPAVRAMVAIESANAAKTPSVALDAMRGLGNSPRADHPILLENFIGAILSTHDWSFMNAARDQGLPNDITRISAQAVNAYPYDPELWAGMGDAPFAIGFANEGMLYYEIAASLPVPGATDLDAIVLREAQIAQLRQRYASLFLDAVHSQ